IFAEFRIVEFLVSFELQTSERSSMSSMIVKSSSLSGPTLLTDVILSLSFHLTCLAMVFTHLIGIDSVLRKKNSDKDRCNLTIIILTRQRNLKPIKGYILIHQLTFYLNIFKSCQKKSVVALADGMHVSKHFSPFRRF